MSAYYFRDSRNNKVNNEENLKILWINNENLFLLFTNLTY